MHVVGRTKDWGQIRTGLPHRQLIAGVKLVFSQPEPVMVDVEGSEPEDDKDENGDATAHHEAGQQGSVTSIQLTTLRGREQGAKPYTLGHLAR